MHYYLYDASCKQRRYRKTIDRIETRLTDLGLHGKAGRLNLLTNARELIQTGKRNNAKTVVIIGQDATFFEAIPELAKAELIIGYIPIDPFSSLGRIMGIPSGELACDVLAQRRIKRLDLGKINEKLFFSSIVLPALQHTVVVEREYTITPLQPCDLQIVNLPDAIQGQRLNRRALPSPTDGVLNVFLEQKKRWWGSHEHQRSHFPSKKMTVLGEGTVAMTLDTRPITMELPLSLRVSDIQCSCIVGKERLFS